MVAAHQRALLAVAQHAPHDARELLQVDRRPVALLQDALVEVVVVVYVQPPAANVGDVHVEALQLHRARLPHDAAAGRVLVPDRDAGHRDTVHLLLEHVPLVPGEDVPQVRVGLVRFHVQRALDLDADVHVRERVRDAVVRQLHAHDRPVAGRLGRFVQQVYLRPGYLERLLHDLWIFGGSGFINQFDFQKKGRPYGRSLHITCVSAKMKFLPGTEPMPFGIQVLVRWGLSSS